ncbi:TetR/AcrR family transcriptional regulator [Lactiplantibacillus plantarum]|uniref:TetR/AcrR family transcriptional regulator n=1 Tax=Lactiplantibacillus plantarum TaxID=1590 RepID=UPI0009328ED6|nr:TetR/AcrR family transcriptional regulator [Lactiplantibacillus plantarum]
MNNQTIDQKIMDAFATLAGSYGYKGTTTRKIAQEAGVNESTIFRHFSDKQDILKGLIQQYQTEISNVEVSFQLSGIVEKDIHRAISIYQYFIEQHQSIFLIALQESRQFPELGQAIQELLQLQKEMFLKLLQKLTTQGQLTPQKHLETEVNNLVLMNFAQAVLKFAYPDTTVVINDQDYLNNNIQIFMSHLKSTSD